MTTILSSTISGLNILLRQLWLSISSIDFYYDVYKIYTGYGIKYLFTVSFISSVISCLFLLSDMMMLKDYLITNQLSNNTASIEYILQQLPNIYYDGNKISIDVAEPVYLYDQNNNRIAAIDPKNQLSYSEKTKIPILFSSNRITIAILEVSNQKKKNINIEYPKLFGSNQQILTQQIIKKYCATILAKMPTILIYIVMPLIIIYNFINIILLKVSFMILLIYLLANFFGPKSNLQTCMRMVFFSSGVSILLQPIILLLKFSNITFFIQIFTNFLLLLGLWRIRNEDRVNILK